MADGHADKQTSRHAELVSASRGRLTDKKIPHQVRDDKSVQDDSREHPLLCYSRKMRVMDNRAFHKGFNFAFTLAEVLITLSIIGVVAAMTIPVMKTAADKQATIVGLKKVYSILTDAVKFSEIDNGTIDTWDFPTTYLDNNQSLTFAKKYLIPYLSVSKKCELSTGCFVQSKKPNGNDSRAPENVQYILNDGMSFYLLNGGYQGTPSNAGKLIIFVDINGDKKPNTMGKDVFSFILAQKAASLYDTGGGALLQNIKSGGIYPDGSGINISGSGYYENRGCGKDVTYLWAGSYCGMKIIQDGWQIKDDYPW